MIKRDQKSQYILTFLIQIDFFNHLIDYFDLLIENRSKVIEIHRKEIKIRSKTRSTIQFRCWISNQTTKNPNGQQFDSGTLIA